MVFSIAHKAISDVIAPVHALLTFLVVNSIDACQGLLMTNNVVPLGTEFEDLKREYRTCLELCVIENSAHLAPCRLNHASTLCEHGFVILDVLERM